EPKLLAEDRGVPQQARPGRREAFEAIKDRLADRGRRASMPISDVVNQLGDEEGVPAGASVQIVVEPRVDGERSDVVGGEASELQAGHASMSAQRCEQTDQGMRPTKRVVAVGADEQRPADARGRKVAKQGQ